MYNPFSPAVEPQNHPMLKEMFDDFFSRVPHMYASLGEEQVILNPLGMPVNLARLDDGSYLLLGGRLEGRELQRLAGFSKKPDKLEVHELSQSWTRMVPATSGEMEEYLLKVAELYNSISRYFIKPGTREILLAVENVNGLISLTFAPGHFDFKAILELITVFIAAITGGGGAFVFSYEHPGRVQTLWCGETSRILKSLADDWRRLGQAKEPARAFDDFARERIKSKHKLTFDGIWRRRNGASVYLGLIGAEGLRYQKALVALAKKAAIALGVSLLSTVFQYRWGMVFNSIRQGIIVTDNKGAILMMNREARRFFSGHGREVPEAGQPITGCDFGRQIDEAVCIAAKSNYSFTQERSDIGEGDAVIHLRWDVVPLLREDGCSAGAVLVFNDITEQIKIYHEAHDWERLATAGEIAASLAHEVRNPLATAKAAIQLALMVTDPLKQEEFLIKLEHELDRMNGILTNFLNISKPRPLEKQEPIDINQVLQELLFLLNSEALLNEIDLEVDLYSGKPLLVLGSSNSIKQVFLNIARNAVEAMEDGGKLNVSTSLHHNKVHVSFKDTGLGIPSKIIATLTNPFFTTKPGGTGLGLYISSSIVKMMEGDLTIESKLGKGTTVKLQLPVYEGAIPGGPVS